MPRTLFEELQDFSGREEALRKIIRYHIYHPMRYRTNDWIHSWRVRRIVRRIAPLVSRHVGTGFDQSLAETMAVVHDDAEILTGDAQAGNKFKMSPSQLAELDAAERNAIEELTARFPVTVGGYNYRDLLLASLTYSSLEARVMKFADRFDAFGEALHEIYAGNAAFATNVVNEYGVIPTPPAFCTDYYLGYAAKNPDLAFLVGGPDRVVDLEFCTMADWKGVAAMGAPHTVDSLKLRTGCTSYDLWKQILLADADPEEIAQLTTLVE